MARKKLNKKVALIGTAVFAVVALAAIAFFLTLGRNPEKCLKNAEAYLASEDYESAIKNFHRARAYAKSDEFRTKVLFRLVDTYMITDQWREVIGCWNGVIKIDPKNVEARFGRLEYFYILAKYGDTRIWQEVQSQTDEFIENIDDPDLLKEDAVKFSSLADKYEMPAQSLESFLYLLRGKAVFEVARMGAITDVDQAIEKAIADLKHVLKLEKDNVDAYYNYAQAVITKGELAASRGVLDEKQKAADEAVEIVSTAADQAPQDPVAAINLLNMKTFTANLKGLKKEDVVGFEPEYIELTKKFSNAPEVYAAVSKYYLQPMMGYKYVERAAEAAEKAVEIDPQNVTYALNAAEAYYRNFTYLGNERMLDKAIETAKTALTFPGTQDVKGPLQFANRMNKLYLSSFVANCTIQQIIENPEELTAEKKQQLLADAEQMVHDIEQIYGSGENPQVIKWQGMLELAKGQRLEAVRKMYTVYEQFKAAGTPDPQLSYALAIAFKNTSEYGAVGEFLASALNARIAWVKPDVLLDYIEILLALKRPAEAIANINAYEDNFEATERSSLLRLNAYIAAGQFDEAEKLAKEIELESKQKTFVDITLIQKRIEQIVRQISQQKMGQAADVAVQLTVDEQSEEEKYLQSQIDEQWQEFAKVIEDAIDYDPDFVANDYVANLCEHYIAKGEIDNARKLVEKLTQKAPENDTVRFYKTLISEPNPAEVTGERKIAIKQEIAQSIEDPVSRALNLGVIYRSYNDMQKANEKFFEVVSSDAADAEGLEEKRRLAGNYIAHNALVTNDVDAARKIAELAKVHDLDQCQGMFYSALADFIDGKYAEAVEKLNETIEERPFFSTAFLIRANVYAAMDKLDLAVEDARKAANYNPLDPMIAKTLAMTLYQRNAKLGDNVNSQQIVETKQAILRALSLSPQDNNLISLYADYIKDENPDQALAIRQNLQKISPSVENALQWGMMAMDMARDLADGKRKTFLLDTALSAFEEARKIEPQNRAVVNAFAEFYRVTGQAEQAEKMIQESEDESLLWRHYFMSGQLDKARVILENLLKEKSDDVEIVKGLVIVVRKAGDKEAIAKYGDILVKLEDNVENRLLDLESLLMAGLTSKAELKLESLKEKYPDEPRSALVEAWLFMRKGELKKALESANRTLEADQDNVVAWRLRGEINLQLTNYDQAISDLSQAKILADDPAARIALAKAYLRVKRNEDAITELRATIDNPKAPIESRLLLEQSYMMLERTAELNKFYDETIEQFPDNVMWINKAAAYAVSQKDYSKAEKLYSTALQKKVVSKDLAANAIDGYLGVLIEQAKYDMLFKVAGQYADTDFASIALLRMAQAKLKMDDRSAAVDYARKAIDKAGTNEMLAASALERMFALLGKDEVYKYCREKISQNPDSLSANITMFNLQKMDGRHNAALEHINKCIEIVGPESQKAIGYYMQKALLLQMAYMKTEDVKYLDDSIAEYESLLVKLPNSNGVLNNLAYILAKHDRRLDDALKYAKKACELSPGEPNFMDTYALALYKNGDYDKAEEVIHAAMQQFERNNLFVAPDVYEHLGMIKEKLGENSEALEAYKLSLDLADDTFSESDKSRIKAAIERLSK